MWKAKPSVCWMIPKTLLIQNHRCWVFCFYFLASSLYYRAPGIVHIVFFFFIHLFCHLKVADLGVGPTFGVILRSHFQISNLPAHMLFIRLGQEDGLYLEHCIYIYWLGLPLPTKNPGSTLVTLEVGPKLGQDSFVSMKLVAFVCHSFEAWLYPHFLDNHDKVLLTKLSWKVLPR